MTWGWVNNDMIFIFIPFITPHFETGTCFQMTVGKCFCFYTLFPSNCDILHDLSAPSWNTFPPVRDSAQCFALISALAHSISVRLRHETSKGPSFSPQTMPFSHSTHGCPGFCAITERLCEKQKDPEWKTWPVRCRNMCRLKSHVCSSRWMPFLIFRPLASSYT